MQIDRRRAELWSAGRRHRRVIRRSRPRPPCWARRIRPFGCDGFPGRRSFQHLLDYPRRPGHTFSRRAETALAGFRTFCTVCASNRPRSTHPEPFVRFKRSTGVLTVLCALFTPVDAHAQYLQRFTTTTAGAITFAGNTLGLDGEVDQNGQGTRGAIGTFITTDGSLREETPPPATAPLFPFGTTSDWRKNRSQAILRMPAEARVVRAELIWGGSFADASGENVSASLDDPISFTTPAGTVDVTPDPATAKSFGSVSGGTCLRCYYVRTADVTALVTAVGPGTYAAGRVPATQGTTDNSSPAAGWTLAVVQEDFPQPIRLLTLMLGLEPAGGATAQASGFCAPQQGNGNLAARLAVTAMEGDAGMTGDQMLFGDSVPL